MREGVTTMVAIPLDGPVLIGEVTIPPGASGIAVFADGTGTASRDPIYRELARRLNGHGLGTVVVDLLTEREGWDPHNRFDVDRLTDRLRAVLDWVTDRPFAGALPLHLVGANTGAAAAVRVSADHSVPVRSLALLAGRIDLASEAVRRIAVPTLLLLGSEDGRTADLVLSHFRRLGCEKALETIDGAGHGLTSREQIAVAADRIADWFESALDRRELVRDSGESGKA